MARRASSAMSGRRRSPMVATLSFCRIARINLSPCSHRSRARMRCLSAPCSLTSSPPPSGHVVFVRDGTLMAQRLDVAAGRLTGDATVLAEGVTLPRSFYGRFFDLACHARLHEGMKSCRALSELRIFDRAGKTVGICWRAGRVYGTEPLAGWHASGRGAPRSDRSGPGTSGCSILRGATDLRLTLDAGRRSWLRDGRPDGRWLMFTSNRRGVRDIYKRRRQARVPTSSCSSLTTHKSVNAWSRDGRYHGVRHGRGRG